MASISEPEKSPLFRQQKKGGVTYRIPSLLYLSTSKTFLAFSEKRSTPADSDAECLVMRRGTFQDGSVQWESKQELLTARLCGFRTMNPCPVYEKKSRVLFLFFICVRGKISEQRQIRTGRNEARLCYIRSTDFGESWGDIKDLTRDVIGAEVENWATFAVGPGHGVQLQCGRLIIPAYVYYIRCRCWCLHFPCCVKPHAFSFYSDDCGQTWHVGKVIQGLKTGECEMAELVDQNGRSHLYCNACSSSRHRVEVLSEKKGAEFSKPHLAPKLVEPHNGCQGSVVSFPKPVEYTENETDESSENTRSQANTASNTWLLYSHPTNRRKRADLGIYLNRSPLDTSCWESPWVVSRGPSGYSDLAHCEGTKWFACLLKCGTKSELEEIAFVRFTLEEVMEKGTGK
ncbi:sialidase-3-like [Huso huso]|uniref:exo-alpha-sialidase n=1 Tax=Huso huso TaxID=61971 RepID=A0ABR0ZNU5_HUSHU